MPSTHPSGLLGHYAGFASRFVALLIDTVIISVCIGILNWTTFTVRSFLDLVVRAQITDQWGIVTFLAQPTPTLVTLASTLFAIGYHLFFLATTGRTPGKAFMGLRVLTTSGKRLSVPRATLRLCGYILSALPLYGGYFWVLIDDRRQALHDKLAGTYVIYTWAARPDERFLVAEIKRLGHSPGEQPRTAGQSTNPS